MRKAYNRETNPAALIKVMPVYRGQALSVAVFIKYAELDFWQQYSRQYWYKKCAENRARIIEIEHFAYKNLSRNAFYKEAKKEKTK